MTEQRVVSVPTKDYVVVMNRQSRQKLHLITYANSDKFPRVKTATARPPHVFSTLNPENIRELKSKCISNLGLILVI